ncbi:putative RNA polymerase II subunit B1 CTD phosphatase rpap2 [Gadus chalcogrammus]|uniref:putative RNA polymerase II subunit B1 CTD phosphatase rpap2 n=1 Tax=Gadus chalcogrammus TaxID=1042646 RepID=UPI0024C4DDD0|nr:putative RNA polymerase II subunit B1 CTD phosphatase rpap2 [Gadus chalcogrammus]
MSAKKVSGSKAVKARHAEEEARRREVLKEALRDKLDLEKRALQVVERLLEDSVPEDFLIDCAKFITPANFKDVNEERFIAKMCGYPICENKLGKVPTQLFKISTRNNKVYDITERKYFCSNFCYKAAKEFELKISTTPLWLRHHESPRQITLLRKGDGGSTGAEVKIAVRRLQEEDIEGPAVALSAPSDPQRPRGLHAPGSLHSDDSDDEQGFVSSIVTGEGPGPRVHWGELPPRTDPPGHTQRQGKEEEEEEEEEEGRHQEGESIVEERGEVGGESVVCKTEDGAGLGGTLNLDAAHAPLPSVQQTPGESGQESSVPAQSVEVEEAVALLKACSIAQQVEDTAPVHTGTGPLQGAPGDGTENKPLTESSQTLDPRPARDVSPPARPCPTPGLDVTQVGMSKRGAAGLRELLLLHHGPAQPNSLRENLLESLRRTLNEWRTDGTRVFLYGPDPAPVTGSEEEKDEGLGEEELDEDDLEEDVVVVVAGRMEDGGRGLRARPSAPAPDYDTLQQETREQELRVQEFYQGSCVLPGDAEQPAGHPQAPAQGRDTKDPILPLVDSQAQTLIQKRITVDQLTRSLRNIVGPLGLTMTDVSTHLNDLVRTFSFTNTNIIHRPPEWTLIAVVLLHLLAEVSAAVQGALAAPGSVQHVNKLLRELSLQRPDLLTLLQLFRTLAH